MKEKFDIFFEGKRNVLILGFGKEGRSTFRFLQEYYPELRLGIADQNGNLEQEKGISAGFHVGKDYLKALDDYDLIIKSPGVSIGIRYNEMVGKITSQTEMFLQIFGGQTIGITGTKGKSTTSTLVYHLIKCSGKDVLLMGNVGSPAFDSLEKIQAETLIVYELSAHQLEHVHCSPHIAAIINLFPEHLDYFRDQNTYQYAKQNIFRFQKKGDMALCGIPVKTNCDCYIMKSPQEEIEILLGKEISGLQLLEMGHLKGQHNLRNFLLALRIVQSAGIPAKESYQYLSTFQPLPHRLEYIGRFGNINFYNDSISTVPQSTIAAIASLENLDALILGGFDRGLDYSELIDFLHESTVSHFFFLGLAGKRMYDMFLSKATDKKLHAVKQLENVFDILSKTPQIKSCLLSPAAASYDQFTNFEHRGDHFKMLAQHFSRQQT